MSYRCTSCDWEGEFVNYIDGPVCPTCGEPAEVKCDECKCSEGNGCCGSCAEGDCDV